MPYCTRHCAITSTYKIYIRMFWFTPCYFSKFHIETNKLYKVKEVILTVERREVLIVLPYLGITSLQLRIRFRSSRPKVFSKKGVLICQEGLSLLLPVSYHQNTSIFPGTPNFYQEVIFTYEHLWISQERAALRTAPFSQEDISFPEQLKNWQEGGLSSEQVRISQEAKYTKFFRTAKTDRKVV